MALTVSEIKRAFHHRGLTISGWALRHGYSPTLVYQILSRQQIPLRGKSHEIAVALGLKPGVIGTYEELTDYLYEAKR